MRASRIAEFQEVSPSLESYWRSVILFGRNASTYKFALSRSLEDLACKGKADVSLDELAAPFSRHMCEHMLVAPKQATGRPGAFIETCAAYNAGTVDERKLIDATISAGFSYVFKAFHNVNGRELPVRFFEVSGRGKQRRIALTDECFRVFEASPKMGAEAEARWGLVEHAWEAGVSTSLVSIEYDAGKGAFYSTDNGARRRSLASAKAALNGYQKGQCFYCYADIELEGKQACDVDHFFPHVLSSSISGVNMDGVWNLVLACSECNRGVGGKFVRVPEIAYLERLSKRNEFLISSHHPLREAIIAQTGATEGERRAFLSRMNRLAIDHLIHRWSTTARGDATF